MHCVLGLAKCLFRYVCKARHEVMADASNQQGGWGPSLRPSSQAGLPHSRLVVDVL